jgi:group I intron endonuclease
MLIYLVINLKSNSIYVGKTIKSLDIRKKQHELKARNNPKTPFHKALISYGYENFIWYELINISNTNDNLNELEKFYIKEFKDDGYNLYNLTDGGDGGDVKNYNINKRKQTMSNWTIEQKNEYRQKLSKIAKEKKFGSWMKGRKQSNEVRKKQSETMKRLLENPLFRQKISHKGEKKKPFSKEHREKLSLLHKGKPKSAEHKKKISESLKNRGKNEHLFTI